MRIGSAAGRDGHHPRQGDPVSAPAKGLPAKGSVGALRLGHLSVPKTGESVCGDRVIVRHGDDGRALIGVIDALGHGPGAEAVAVMADEHLSKARLDAPLEDMMLSLHERLRGSRGAAATLCLFAGQELSACGVGNVELRCSGTSLPFVLSAGILGMRVPKWRTCRTRLLPQSRLVLFSDGISSRFRFEDVRSLRPQDACRRVIETSRHPEDDATVLIADFG
jgi:phosphoserine phosphatase RsbX